MTAQQLQMVLMVVIFAIVLLLFQAIYWWRTTLREREMRELARRLGTVVERQEDALFRSDPINTRATGSGSGDSLSFLEKLLLRAGEPFPMATLMIRIVLFAVVGLVAGLVITRSPIGALGLLAGLLPLALLHREAGIRNEKMTEQLPDALDLMARSLQSGHGISESMRMCAEEMPMPISVEFGRVYEQHNLGRDFREAMNQMLRRNANNFDLKIFVSAVLLQRDTGGNLIEILNNIAGTIRKRFIFHGKVRSLTAEAKFSAVVLAILPLFVTVAILYVQPDYLLPLIEDPFGNLLLFIAGCLLSIGLFVMYEISKVEV